MQLRRILVVTLICAMTATAVFLLVTAAQAETTLVVHAGAGIRPPLDELGEMFEKSTGTRVKYNYKGSGCLLTDICFSQTGDAYIPGESFYIEQAAERGFITESRIVAQMSTVLIVPKGNPKDIRGLGDLTKRGVRLGLGDPEAVAVGRAASQALVKAGLLKEVEGNTRMKALNVVELGIGVKLGHLDAAIVWDATAHLFGDAVETLELPEEWRVDALIPVGALEFSKHPVEVRRYLSFLASEKAAGVFVKHGYGLPPKPEAEDKKE
jgi:molybdate transport system substrate-binding protein